MPQTSDGNVHAPQYREAKPSQGDPSLSVSQLFRLDNRTIIITGATGFLGSTLAIAILESGADVVCLDLPPTPTAENWNDVKTTASRHEQQLSYYQLDVTDEDAVADTFAKFLPTLRYPVRGLVTCAGLSLNGPSSEFPASAFRKVLDINVTGTFLVAKATARAMISANTTGSMVFVASMSGYGANKGVDTAGYNSSKAAVHQLTRSLAAEWGSRVGLPLIRVNSLSPGYIRTAATAEALQKPGMEDQWTGDNMLYRLSRVDEFRAPVLFMLGDGSSFMTGADLRVDGGHCSW
uniref:Short chain dehydrogenases/reductase notP' n=1 Tax=Aspergillus versicolor TaxID=46472 RepID=NOTP_ASPVE|nr:RecName: Full=Short chain dehydrogenases/reductase notP'; AltName: Full=Notoamide biosynthesis cluster protein P' [Aspergillus versicolor]AGC83587.1 short chain dehydrogenase [Aspergillus versicolor]